MKTTRLTCLSLLLLCLAPAARGQFNYATNSGQATVTITGYTGSAGSVNVPGTIHGVPVTAIGDAAFEGCASLTNVAIANGVLSIGSMAFERCTNLVRITIPGSVTNIGWNAFWGCVSLGSVGIPAGVTNIGGSAFAGCAGLTNIAVDPLNPCYASADGVLFDKAMARLVVCPNGKTGSYAIPNSVTDIGQGAFDGCARLAGVTIPNSVGSIGSYAFGGCAGLTNASIPNSVTNLGSGAFEGCARLAGVTIPNSVDSIGYYVFAGCTNLAGITIPGSVTNIGSGAFQGCISLANVMLPNSVVSIGSYAFEGCTNLAGVTIPGSVSNIGSGAFRNCISLQSVSIPAGVTSIGSSAFAGCASLTNIAVDPLNPCYASADGVLFDKAMARLLACPGGKTGSYAVPSGVTGIGSSAFEGCAGLAGVSLPDSVTNIESFAFYYCTNLAGVTIPAGLTLIGEYAFTGCSSLASIAIPAGVTRIGLGAFRQCRSLTGITVDAGNSRYTSAVGVLFDKNMTTLIQCPGGKAGNYAVPGTVTNIGDYAFVGCGGLTSVAIPAGVTIIGYGAFYGCDGLKCVLLAGDAPLASVGLFSPAANGQKPVLWHMPGASGWAPSFGGLPALVWGRAVSPFRLGGALSLTLFGRYAETLAGSAGGGQAVLGAGSGSLKATLLMTGVDVAAFNGSTELSIRLDGNLVFHCRLGDAAGYKPGNRAIRWTDPRTGLALTVSWTGHPGISAANLLTISGSSLTNDIWGLKALYAGRAGKIVHDQHWLNVSLGNFSLPGRPAPPPSPLPPSYPGPGSPPGSTPPPPPVPGGMAGGSPESLAASPATVFSGYFQATVPVHFNGTSAVTTRVRNGRQYGLATVSVNGAPHTAAPAVTILRPSANYTTVSGDPITFIFKAADHFGVDSVFYLQRNGAGACVVFNEAAATATNGLWTATITPQPGTNYISVTARDAAGNQSATVTRSVFYKLLSPLTVARSGAGRVTGVADQQALQVGNSYTAVAVPAAGSVFANWRISNGQTNGYCLSSNLTFVMGPGLAITATFVTNPYQTVKGNYTGLFLDHTNGVDLTNAGLFTLTVSSNGSYSGKLTLASGSYPFSGQLGIAPDTGDAVASFELARSNWPSLSGALDLDCSGAGMVTGVCRAHAPGYSSEARFEGWPVTNAAPAVYNLAASCVGLSWAYGYTPFPVARRSDNDCIEWYGLGGYSYGTATVGSSGAVNLLLTLSDQSPAVAAGSFQTVSGGIPVFAPLYHGQGLLLGWLGVDASGAVRVEDFAWLRLPGSTGFYSNGFKAALAVTGARYVPVEPPANLLGWTNGTITFGLTDSNGVETRTVLPLAFDPAGGTFSILGDNASQVSLVFTQSIGMFSGSFTPAGAAQAGGFKGIILPAIANTPGAGYGWYTGGGLPGSVTIAPAYAFANFAGQPGGPGNIDGQGSGARFNRPSGVAVDAAGNVYVADTDNHTIRKVTPAGVATTLAGSPGSPGSADGTGDGARFDRPSGVAVDAAGNVYVADSGNDTIRKVTPAGVVTTLAGSPDDWGSADGTGSDARFEYPEGVAVDSAGNLYVADTYNQTIRKVTSAGVVSTLAGSAGNQGSADGTGSAAQFSYPRGVAVDSAGNVYVADSWNSTIRQVSPGGVVTTMAGSPGTSGGPAWFSYPCGVTVDAAGNIYVADAGSSTIRKMTPAGAVTTLAGWLGQQGSADGMGNAAQFSQPSSIAVDSAGNLYVADTGNSAIRKVTPDGLVTTLAGSNTAGSADGTGNAARFNNPLGVAVDNAGNVYVADTDNRTIRKVNPGGVVTTLAGSPGLWGRADGMGSAARFGSPQGVAVDAAGNVYVADSDSATIRKITPTGAVTTLAGSPGNWGSADGTGDAAQFSDPQGVAVDATGNVYVADSWSHTIRKVTPAGVVTTLAGSPGNRGYADGIGSAARFSDPQGVAVDAAGNVYVADSGNGTIRKVTPAGVVSTLAGSRRTWGSVDGTGSAAAFYLPRGVAVDVAGNVYVADSRNHTIRKVTPNGMVTTIGGTPGVMAGADGIGPAAQFGNPSGIAVDAAGNLYIADSSNNRISKGARF